MNFINKLSLAVKSQKQTTYIVALFSLLIIAGGLWYLGANGYLFKSSQAAQDPDANIGIVIEEPNRNTVIRFDSQIDILGSMQVGSNITGQVLIHFEACSGDPANPNFCVDLNTAVNYLGQPLMGDILIYDIENFEDWILDGTFNSGDLDSYFPGGLISLINDVFLRVQVSTSTGHIIGEFDSEIFTLMSPDDVVVTYNNPNKNTVWRFDDTEYITGTVHVGKSGSINPFIIAVKACAVIPDVCTPIDIINIIVYPDTLPLADLNWEIPIIDLLPWTITDDEFMEGFDFVNNTRIRTTITDVFLPGIQNVFDSDVFSVMRDKDLVVVVTEPGHNDILRITDNQQIKGDIYIGADVISIDSVLVEVCVDLGTTPPLCPVTLFNGATPDMPGASKITIESFLDVWWNDISSLGFSPDEMFNLINKTYISISVNYTSSLAGIDARIFSGDKFTVMNYPTIKNVAFLSPISPDTNFQLNANMSIEIEGTAGANIGESFFIDFYVCLDNPESESCIYLLSAGNHIQVDPTPWQEHYFEESMTWDSIEEDIASWLSSGFNLQNNIYIEARMEGITSGIPHGNFVSETLSIIPTVQFTTSTSSVPESVTPYSIDVALDIVAESQLIVAYEIMPGGLAELNDDYSIATPWTIQFDPGEQYKTINIDIVPDIIPESDEDFSIILSSIMGSGAIGALNTHTVTIEDDDDPVVIPIVQFNTDSSTVTETESTFIHTITVDYIPATPPATSNTTVIYEVRDGTAKLDDNDYHVASPEGLLVFDPIDPTSQLLYIDIIGDTVPEGDEYFSIVLKTITNGIIGTPFTHTVTILDDDDPVALPTVQFALSNSDAPEATSPHSVEVTLDKSSTDTIQVGISVNDGSAVNGDDYFIITPDTLTFNPEETSHFIDIDILDDNEDEGDEDFYIEITGVTNGDPGSQLTHTVTILDNDEQVVSFIVDAPDKIATNLPFDVTITALDQYDSIITNFDDSDITLGHSIGTYMSLISWDQGILSAWENGVATFQNAVIGFTMAVGTTSDTGKILVDHNSISASGEDDVEFIIDLVTVELPNDLTIWDMESTENIIFFAGGATAVDYIAIYYSESQGLEDTWVLIDDAVTYNPTQPQSYPWDIPIMTSITGPKDFMIKVETYDTSAVLIAEGTSDLFVIRLAPELVGTYISQEFVIANPLIDEVLKSIDGFSAFADEDVDGINSKLEFFVRFITSTGYLDTTTEGWIEVNQDGSTNLDPVGLDVSSVEKVQFKIYMETVDIDLYSPWVESMLLDYTVIIPDLTSDFNIYLTDDSPRTTTQGSSLIFDINVHRDQNPSFIEAIEFSSDILTDITIWDEIVDQDSASSGFGSPPLSSVEDGIITLTIKILDIVDVAYLDNEYNFTITATSTGTQALVRSVDGYITVSSDEDINNPAITINASVPLELGLSSDLLTPEFTLRLYESTVTDPDDTEHEVSGITADSYDTVTKTATLQIDIAEGILTNNTTYASYIRTTRHLWDKATSNFTVAIDDITDDTTYDITFPTLVIGDISLDNVINTFDFNLAIIEFGKVVILPLSLLADFNNDGVVNAMDIGLLFPNWFKSGELPSS